jgi:histone acetyltransferase (RNA polymerase elongator complex component)
MKPFIIPIFISHLGCPHRCIFCNQEIATGIFKNKTTPSSVSDIVQEFLRYKTNNRRDVQIAFYGGSFTALPAGRQIEFLKVAQEFIQRGQAKTVRISTRPDYVNKRILDVLQTYHVGIVELGVQSMDEEVLTLARRGHTAQDTVRAGELLRKRGLAMGIHLMLGLPGDNREKAILSAEKTISLRPDFVRIHPTLVIRNTPLASLLNRGLYAPMGLEEAVCLCKEIVLLFEQHHIPVIRMGIQPSSSLEKEGNLIGGPYHPAFGELVRSSILLDKVKAEIQRYMPTETISIQVSPYDLSILKGQRNTNISHLLGTFKLDVLKINANPQVERGMVLVSPN